MMEVSQTSVVSELREKINRLLNISEILKEENRSLRIEMEGLRESLLVRESELSEIKEKYKQLQLSRALLTGEEDTTEAKNNINRIVREIDKCIALLNR